MNTRRYALIAAVIGAITVGGMNVSAQAQSPAASDTGTVEGCSFDDASGNWLYSNGSLCRGTGEDPTADAQGNPVCANGNVPGIHKRHGVVTVTCVRKHSRKGGK